MARFRLPGDGGPSRFQRFRVHFESVDSGEAGSKFAHSRAVDLGAPDVDFGADAARATAEFLGYPVDFGEQANRDSLIAFK